MEDRSTATTFHPRIGSGSRLPDEAKWHSRRACARGILTQRPRNVKRSVDAPGRQDRALGMWRRSRLGIMPPRDLERTPCRHPCRAENLLVEVYHNRRKSQNGSGSILATLTWFFSHSAPENHVETRLLASRLTITTWDAILMSIGVPLCPVLADWCPISCPIMPKWCPIGAEWCPISCPIWTEWCPIWTEWCPIWTEWC